MTPCEQEWIEALDELSAEGWQVGWQYNGNPRPDVEHAALTEMLDKYGRSPDVWLLPPTIIVRRAQVRVEQGPETLLVAEAPTWAVYGILESAPSDGGLDPWGGLPTREIPEP